MYHLRLGLMFLFLLSATAFSEPYTLTPLMAPHSYLAPISFSPVSAASVPYLPPVSFTPVNPPPYLAPVLNTPIVSVPASYAPPLLFTPIIPTPTPYLPPVSFTPLASVPASFVPPLLFSPAPSVPPPYIPPTIITKVASGPDPFVPPPLFVPTLPPPSWISPSVPVIPPPTPTPLPPVVPLEAECEGAGKTGGILNLTTVPEGQAEGGFTASILVHSDLQARPGCFTRVRLNGTPFNQTITIEVPNPALQNEVINVVFPKTGGYSGMGFGGGSATSFSNCMIQGGFLIGQSGSSETRQFRPGDQFTIMCNGGVDAFVSNSGMVNGTLVLEQKATASFANPDLSSLELSLRTEGATFAFWGEVGPIEDPDTDDDTENYSRAAEQMPVGDSIHASFKIGDELEEPESD